MTSIPCFLLTPADLARESLRRYASASCSLPAGHHTASVVLGQVPWLEDSNGSGDSGDDYDKDDPRWPKACACGYEFTSGDAYQHNYARLFLRTETGEHFALEEAPPGAMFYADWYPEAWRGSDGHTLVVMLPNKQQWVIDHGTWTRTGTPPKVTATPSILANGGPLLGTYHGHLVDGVLVAC